MPKRRGHVAADERFASKIFTDRKKPRIAFWDIYERVRADRDDALAISFYGIGGEGKTSTLQKLQNEIQEVECGKPIEDVKREILESRSEPLDSGKAPAGSRKVRIIPHARYDFNDGTEEVAVLRRLADTLNKDYGFSFPFFDIAYCKFTYGSEDSNSTDAQTVKLERLRYLTNHPIMEACLDVAGAIVPYNIPAIIADVVKLGEKWASYRNGKKVESKLSALDGVSEKEEVAKCALSYFIEDLKTNMQGQEEPTVLFLDTYEKLADYGRNGDFSNVQDVWVRQLIDGVPGLLCVIAGRDRIRWEELEGKEGGDLEGGPGAAQPGGPLRRGHRPLPHGDGDLRQGHPGADLRDHERRPGLPRSLRGTVRCRHASRAGSDRRGLRPEPGRADE